MTPEAEDRAFLERIKGIFSGRLCACGAEPMHESDTCEVCVLDLKCHRVRGQWFSLPNGPGSDVGPFSSEDEALQWIKERAR